MQQRSKPNSFASLNPPDFSSTGGLSSSQAKAIHAALQQTLTLWQGPPGTGKTSTLLHFLRLAAHKLFKEGSAQVLACAASNVAVDGLVKGLLKHGVHVVRMGQPAKVSMRGRHCIFKGLVRGLSLNVVYSLLQS